MVESVLAFVLIIAAIGGVVMRKVYYAIPVTELKRQAADHQAIAVTIYPAVAYGSSLRFFLGLYIGLTSALSIVCISRLVPVWLAPFAVLFLLWIIFYWLPATRLTEFGTRITVRFTPLVLWLLNYLHPLLSKGNQPIEKHYANTAHTKLYEPSDLLVVIDRQRRQGDSRFSPEQLEIAQHVLSFGDYQVHEIMISRETIKMVKADEVVGPVLIDELHKLDQPFVLVGDGPKAGIVGSLRVRSLGLQSTGMVRDLMEPAKFFLHEDESLAQALHAFFTTHCSLLIILNDEQACVGVLIVEAVIDQLLGQLPGDDFDQYHDPEAVAKRLNAPILEAEPEKESIAEKISPEHTE